MSVMLLTDEKKYRFQELPTHIREQSELIKLPVGNWASWATKDGKVRKRSPLLAAVKHDLGLLGGTQNDEHVYAIANRLLNLVFVENPNWNRDRLWYTIESYQRGEPHIGTLFFLLVAPTPEYKPGYSIDSRGVVTDTAGQKVATITGYVEGSNALDTYLHVDIKHTGIAYPPWMETEGERKFVAPPNLTFTQDSHAIWLAIVYTLLEFCERNTTPLWLVEDDTTVGVVSGSAQQVRTQVVEAMRAKRVHPLILDGHN